MCAPLRKSQAFQVIDSVPNSNNTHIHILKRSFQPSSIACSAKAGSESTTLQTLKAKICFAARLETSK